MINLPHVIPDENPDETQITEDDARAIVRLLGDVIVSPGEHAGKKRLLMDGLCRLVGADCWMWTQFLYDAGKHDPAWVNINSGGFSEGQRCSLYQALDHPDCAAVHDRFMASVEAIGGNITGTPRQFDPQDKVRFRDPTGVWAHADIVDLIATYRRLGPGLYSSVGLYRRLGRLDFDARELRIAHIVFSEVPWLHESGWPDNRLEVREAPNLSRRERLVLHGIMAGDSPKVIASALRISTNTVNDYVKSVYRHFGVNSRAQLLARFTRGDGGDRA